MNVHFLNEWKALGPVVKLEKFWISSVYVSVTGEVEDALADPAFCPFLRRVSLICGGRNWTERAMARLKLRQEKRTEAAIEQCKPDRKKKAQPQPRKEDLEGRVQALETRKEELEARVETSDKRITELETRLLRMEKAWEEQRQVGKQEQT